MRDVTTRTLTIYYVTALSVIAGLSILCHFLLASQLNINLSAAALINMSGRQRMLSQRIAGMASQYALGVPWARGELLASIDTFEREHQQLIEDVAARNHSDEETSRLLSIYGQSLNAETSSYIADARRVAATPVADPAFSGLLADLANQARSPLLNALDGIVTIRQQTMERQMARLQSIQWGILTLVLLTLLVEAMTVFRPMVRRIVAYTEQLLHLASVDALTGAANRRSFLDSATAEMHRSQRYIRPLSLLALDIDHFKSINDTYGHAAGDAVLTAFAAALTRGLRSADLLGRVGGEEFAILLPETAIDGALEVAERLRAAVAALRLPSGPATISATVSIGVTHVTTRQTTISELMAVADKALYQAKTSGRNRVVSLVPKQDRAVSESVAFHQEAVAPN